MTPRLSCHCHLEGFALHCWQPALHLLPLQPFQPERSLWGSMRLLLAHTWNTPLFSHICACIMYEPRDMVLASLSQAECWHLRGPVLKGM